MACKERHNLCINRASLNRESLDDQIFRGSWISFKMYEKKLAILKPYKEMGIMITTPLLKIYYQIEKSLNKV